MKRCSMWLAMREMRIKVTRYHYVPTKRAKIKKTDHVKCW